MKIFPGTSKAFWKHCFWFLYLQLVSTEKQLRKKTVSFNVIALPRPGSLRPQGRLPQDDSCRSSVLIIHTWGAREREGGRASNPLCWMWVPSLLLPSRASASPQLHLVPGPQSWSPGRAKTTSLQGIGGNGSCIFWLSAIVINGKVVRFLTSQFLLRKLYQPSLSSWWIR